MANDRPIRELSFDEIDMISGAGSAYDNGKALGVKVGEAIEEVGDAIKEGWNKLVAWVS